MAGFASYSCRTVIDRYLIQPHRELATKSPACRLCDFGYHSCVTEEKAKVDFAFLRDTNHEKDMNQFQLQLNIVLDIAGGGSLSNIVHYLNAR